jgi:hypothetical protein
MQVEFVGSRWALFWLALKTGFLTVITLGIYRFWMKTRLRRWYWSAIRPGGHPMEYVGDPIEKLLGFQFLGLQVCLVWVSGEFRRGDPDLVLCAVSGAAVRSGAHPLARGAVRPRKRRVGLCVAGLGALGDHPLHLGYPVASHDVLA